MANNLKIRYWFTEVVAALFVLLFLYTAISKLNDYTGFARAMLHSPVIASYAKELAIAVPVCELIAVFLLALPTTRLWGLVLSSLMMCLFTVYIGYMLATSSDLPCTCGGILEHMTWPQHLVVNMIFLLLGVSAVIINHKDVIMINRSRRIPV